MYDVSSHLIWQIRRSTSRRTNEQTNARMLHDGHVFRAKAFNYKIKKIKALKRWYGICQRSPMKEMSSFEKNKQTVTYDEQVGTNKAKD